MILTEKDEEAGKKFIKEHPEVMVNEIISQVMKELAGSKLI